jgi:hypothetical protein
MVIQVKDPVKEHEGSKDQYISYAVRTQVRRALGLSDANYRPTCLASRISPR